MAFLQNLIVTGGSKFLNKIYATDIEVDGTFETSGNLSIGGTLDVAGNTTLKVVTTTYIDNSGTFINRGGVELSHATPYIDFRFGKSTSDYTSRIIEEASGTITIKPNLKVGTSATIPTATITTANITTGNLDSGTADNFNVTNKLHATHFDLQSVAQLGGAFYVSPTIKFPTDSNTTFTITKSGATANIIISDSAITSTTLAGVVWGTNAKVKASGKIGTVTTGTMDGTVTGINTSNHTLTISVSGENSSSITAGTYTSADIDNFCVMMYNTGTYPVGIMMNSYGTDGRTYIDIHGGTSSATEPNVRIGNLGGLSFNGTTLSNQWGIYTNNGYYTGSIVANGGKIGGFTIGSTAIYTGTLTANSDNNIGLSSTDFTRTIGSTSRIGLRFAIGDKVGITGDGILYAHSLQASGGKIGGWNIASDFLYNYSTVTTGTASTQYGFRLCVGTSQTNQIIRAGSRSYDGTNYGSWENKFYVRNDGYMYAVSGNIGGWTIGTNTLSRGTIGTLDGVFLIPAGSTNNYSIGGSESINDWTITSGANFGVTASGAVYCSDIHATGEITATSGHIGTTTNGFTIDASGFYSGTKTANTSGYIAMSNTAFSRTINDTALTNLNLAIGSKFGVTSDGTLYANGLNIKNIDADNISIGTLSIERLTSLQIGGRNLAKNCPSADWYTVNITDGTNKNINLFGQNNVHDWIDLTQIPDIKVGDTIQVSFDIKFGDNWQATGTGTKQSIVQGQYNGTSGTWKEIPYNPTYGGGGQKSDELQAIMSSSSKEGHINTYFKITQNMLDGTYTGIAMSNIRFDYYSGSVSVRHVMVEKGTKPTNWSPAPEDVDNSINQAQTTADTATTKIDNLKKPQLGWKVNYSAYTQVNNGECYFHGYDSNNAIADVDGKVDWNGEELTITKGMWINPNQSAPYNTPILHVYRTSTTPYHADVWWDNDLGKWRGYMYKTDKTPDVRGDWTWNEVTDCILATYIEPSADGEIQSAQLFNPPKKYSELPDPSVSYNLDNLKIGGRNLLTKAKIISYNNPYTEENYVYTGTYGNGAGLKLSSTIFTVGVDYILSFKLKKVTGTLTSIGGHSNGFTTNKFLIDGIEQSNTYGTSGLINDDTETHSVEVYLTYNGNASDNNLYIQPNRNHYNSSNDSQFQIWDLQIEIGNKVTDWTPAPEDVDSAISSVKDIADTALSQGVEYIVGTQTATTASWTGVTTDSVLVAGKTIAYKLPQTSASNATLNLTLSTGATTGAKAVYYNTTRVSTQYPANSIIHMTYDGSYWRITNYNSDTVNRIRLQNVITAAEAITAGNIICGTSSGYRDIEANVSFDLTYPLLYAATAKAKGGTSDNNFLSINAINVSSNGTITSGATGKILYLKGTVNNNTFTISASPFMTTVIPTTEDGFIYIPLGIMYSATNIYFNSSDKLYAYKDGSFKELSRGEASLAAKTATNYLYYDTTNGLVISSSASSQTYSGASTGYNTRLTNSALQIRNGTNVLASYGSTITIGKSGNSQQVIDNTTLKFKDGKGDTQFTINNNTTGYIKDYKAQDLILEAPNSSTGINKTTLATALYNYFRGYTCTSNSNDYCTTTNNCRIIVKLCGGYLYNEETGPDYSEMVGIYEFDLTGLTFTLNNNVITATKTTSGDSASSYTTIVNNYIDKMVERLDEMYQADDATYEATEADTDTLNTWVEVYFEYPIISTSMTLGTRSGNLETGCGSLSVGKDNNITGNYSVALGEGLEVNSDYSTVIGSYNLPLYNSNTGLPEEVAFAVGAGDGSERNRRTPFAVLKNGTVVMSNNNANAGLRVTVAPNTKETIVTPFAYEMPFPPFIFLTLESRGKLNNIDNIKDMGKIQIYLHEVTTKNFTVYIINNGDRSHEIGWRWFAICTN